MNIKFYTCLEIILVVNLFIGCTDTSIKAEEPLKQIIDNTPKITATDYSITEQKEMMYKFLVAELSNLRGDYKQAAEYSLNIAAKFYDVKMAQRATEIALRTNQYSIAMEAASLWVIFAPNNPTARQILSSLSIMQGRVDEAVLHLDIIFNILQNNPKQLELLMEAILEQHENSAFIPIVLEKLQIKYPNDPAILLAQARLYMNNEQMPKALNTLHTLLTTNPDHERAIPLYAYVLNQMGQIDESLLWLGQALSKYPNKSEWRLIYARMLSNAGRYEEAVMQFEILLSSSPPEKRDELLHTLGILSLQNQDFSKANRYFAGLIKIRKKVSIAYYYLGVIAQEQDKWQKAIDYFSLVEGSTHYLNAQIQIALILAKQRKLEAAIQHLHNISVSDVDEQINLTQLEAELLIEQKFYQRALEAYEYALSLKPNDTEVLYMQALLYEKIGKIDLLEKNLKYVLSLEPENIGALNALGYSLTQYTNRYQEAYKLIKKAFDLSSEDYYILDSMGWVLYKLGNHIGALAHLRKAKVQQDDPEILAHLGVVLWKSGDRAAAVEIWKKAHILFPDDEKLEEIVQHECQLDIKTLF